MFPHFSVSQKIHLENGIFGKANVSKNRNFKKIEIFWNFYWIPAILAEILRFYNSGLQIATFFTLIHIHGTNWFFSCVVKLFQIVFFPEKFHLSPGLMAQTRRSTSYVLRIKIKMSDRVLGPGWTILWDWDTILSLSLITNI